MTINRGPASNNPQQIAVKACPKWFYDEVEEDLQGLANTLKQLDVKVNRPTPFDQDAMNQDGLNTRSRLFDIREGKLYRKD